MENMTRRQFWTCFVLLWGLMTAYALYQGRAFIFGPAILETGDFAANGMQIYDARFFDDIWGNYSRWGFSHPGPFFFYMYSFGERLFMDTLHLVESPHQAHVITGTLFQAACIAFAICLLTLLTRRRLTLALCLAMAAWLLPRTLAAFTSIWPPHVLFGPYVVLIVSCAAISVGYRKLIPVAVFVTCVLCHGHVAQPLMTIPMLALATALFLRHEMSRGESLRSIIGTSRNLIWLSFAIIAVFLAPLVVDLTRCPNCNAKRIVDYFRTDHGPRPRTGQALNYVFSYLRFDHNPEWLDNQRAIHRLTHRVEIGIASLVLLLGAPWLLRKRMERAQFLALGSLALFTTLATILSIFWAKRITGPLYEFNAFFVYGVVFVGACTLVSTIAMVIRKGCVSGATAGLAAGATVALVACGPSLPMFTSTATLAMPDAAGARAHLPAHPVLLNQDKDEDWSATTALALWLTRNDVDFLVPPSWAYVYGWKHSLELPRVLALDDRFEIWEPGDDKKILDNKTFDITRFCHITSETPAVELGSAPVSIDDARDHCTVAAFGLNKPPRDPASWNTAPFMALQFVGKHTDQPVTLKLDVTPFVVPGKIDEQVIGIYVNGKSLGDVHLKESQVVSLIVPPDVWNATKVVTVALAFPDAASPLSLGASVDSRVLALSFHGMGIQYNDH
ncbi:hypothetical protein [Dyella sp. C9]|uniref:hypothetical protein n=1 Tax=Dyella sp. C9 TaxID=2202154 RepID=UPI000DEF327B|nr:hypothetical protein [Dyella sp. C9]